MGAAIRAGPPVAFGYGDLGAIFAREGRHEDAFRAYLKAKPGEVAPQRKALENVGNAILDR